MNLQHVRRVPLTLCLWRPFPALLLECYYFWSNSQCVRRVPLTLCLWETISRTFSSVIIFGLIHNVCAGCLSLCACGDHFPHFSKAPSILDEFTMCAQDASHVVACGRPFPTLLPKRHQVWINLCVRRVPLTLCLWETISHTTSKAPSILDKSMCALGASHLVLVGDHFPHFY